MFERYTEKARRVIFFARYEASQFGAPAIEPEHLLLGLIKLGHGVAIEVLQTIGVNLETVRTTLEALAGTAPGQKMVGKKIPYTPRAKKVLALAASEAQALHHTYVGTEHILLGLLQEGESAAARLLKNLDVKLDEARREILKELNSGFTGADEFAGTDGASPKPFEIKGEVRTLALKAFGRDLTEIAR
jgi:ATP-dependent Clp protease ATP-binding subunit ClpC